MPVIGRDFELARRERNAQREPTRIVMGGEEFTLLPTIPLAATFDLADAPEPDDDKVGAARACAKFIRLALAPGDEERWDEMLARKDDVVDPADLIAYAAMIAEVYTARPTRPSSGSSAGRRGSGEHSKSSGTAGTSRPRTRAKG